MKRTFGSIPQLYRNVRRWTEIVSVLSKYGLSDWLSRVNLPFINERLKAADGEVLAELSQGARIRCALSELGPTFIKFGQLLSTRPDVIGPEIADELSRLQSDTPKDPFNEVKEVVESELGRPIAEMFSTFEEDPIASASIGQVHCATLQSEFVDVHEQMERVNGWYGQPRQGAPVVNDANVVVKVRHTGIERIIETDLDIMAGLATLAERIDDFRNYQPCSVVSELSRTMRRETDFEREFSNLVQFRAMFEGDETIAIPFPVPQLCSSRVITMQRMRGTKLRDVKDSPKHRGLDLDALAREGANLYLKMIFHHGFYHADPHPGNILITDDGKIGLLDFGMVGRISESLREDIEAMLVAIVNQDVPMLTTLIKRIGNCPIDLNESALSNDIADFVGQYSTQVVSHFDMSGALNDFVSIVRRYNITLPSEASLLIKVLITLEGTSRLLNPSFSLMEIMKPFQRMLILKRLSPTRQMRKMRRFYMQMEQLGDALPSRISNILEQIQTGRFDVHLDHRRLGPSVNRLVMGLMTSALFLGSSLMLSYQVPPLMFPGSGPLGIRDLSMLGVMGSFISIMMGLRLTWAIRKSGNLDQQD